MKDTLKTYKTIGFMFILTIAMLMYVNQQVLIYQMGIRVKENYRIYSKLIDRNDISI